MKKRRIFLAGLCLIVLSAIWLLIRHTQKTPVTTVNSGASSTNVAERAVRARNEEAVVDPAVAKSDSQTPLNALVENGNVPIRFWGKVVDQNDTPLEGVLVAMSVRKRELITPDNGLTRFVPLQRITDKDGRFEVVGERGGVLTIEHLEKAGYVPLAVAGKNFGFNTSNPHEPSIEAPHAFRMMKQDTVPILFRTNLFFGVKPDGRAYTVSLREGRKTEGVDPNGDLKIALMRGPIQNGDQFDWEFTLECLKGGILPVNEPTDAYAPEGKYHLGYRHNIAHDDPDWSDGVRRRSFYFFNGREYGILRLDVRADYNGEAVFDFRVKINTSGTRIVDDGKHPF